MYQAFCDDLTKHDGVMQNVFDRNLKMCRTGFLVFKDADLNQERDTN